MMPENPLEPGVAAGASKLKSDLSTIERSAGNVAPLGRRLLTRREKLLSSLATPARDWTSEQSIWVLKELMRQRKG